VTANVFFRAPSVLPRGRHAIDREQVLAVQRERIMAATTELLAASGYHALRVGAIAEQAGVSRTALYDSFTTKDDCVYAGAYRFTAVVEQEMTRRVAAARTWDQCVEALLTGFYGTLARDLVTARAYMVEIDAIGPEARQGRRAQLTQFYNLIFAQLDHYRQTDPTLQRPTPEWVRAILWGTRQAACDALETDDPPDLLALVPSMQPPLAASFRPGDTGSGL
jgi:AcrR family transcriptional regulator